MNQAAKQTTIQQQLLQHMIEQQDLEIYDLMLANEQGLFTLLFCQPQCVKWAIPKPHLAQTYVGKNFLLV